MKSRLTMQRFATKMPFTYSRKWANKKVTININSNSNSNKVL